MKGLIKRFFGIYVPPFKRTKFKSDGAISIWFVLEGGVPSKKNQKKAVTEQREARKYVAECFTTRGTMSKFEVFKALDMCYSRIVANEFYSKFLSDTKPLIIEQMQDWSGRFKDRGLIFPINKATLSLQLFFKGQYITDTINKLQTLQDLLVDCGVISDDNYKVLNPIHAESACYYEEILKDISKITLTINI